MSVEEQVARHYTRGNIEETILEMLKADGKNIEALKASDLSGADEFHLGWRAATIEFAKQLDLAAGMEVLDIGSGLGGPARYFAEAHGCRVTGIDLTEEFVEVATSLTRRVGLSALVTFRQGSALSLPFPRASFDVATLIHVGMNIADKAALFAEARRVLKPGGRFGLYEITRANEAEIPYPMPWAGSPETSFVEPPATYRRLLEAAGFDVKSERNRRDFVLKLVAEMRVKAAAGEAPRVSINATAAPERLANLMKTLEAGTIAPVEIITRAD